MPSESQLEQERLIGRGLTSEVFGWGKDRVLKLNLAWVPVSTAQREFAVTCAVHGAGVNVPAVFELVQVGGRHGIVFERVHGPSMVSEVEKRPWSLFAAARQLAELHARLHDFDAPPELPSQREQIESWIDRAPDFSAAEKDVAHRNLARLPAGKCICHGDFHPANIILSARGAMIIDWSRGTRGHALADECLRSVFCGWRGIVRAWTC
ncbi:MAG TPA: phosphotransferase [Candidatus Binatia bacterium]|nr:phosphotransferase [Candidatus Binatia bacterium]